mmetsp:Transcript_53067/g.147727  ORF Transcript_53067/g.147727 Transcript_53067/m.147727 type:complete len:776 (+) Transcript_53067:2-2329(+)
MEEMRQKQMEEQKRRLDENRKMLEEANRKRIEEQQQKMAMMKQQQEEMAKKTAEEKKKREEEMIRKREEQRATLAIRRVAQKLRMAPVQNVEEAKKELEEIMAKELTNCNNLQDKMHEECQAAIKSADAKVQALEEAKRKDEERRAAEEQRRKEQAEKAAKLLEDLSGLVGEAEAALHSFTTKAEPLANGTDLASVEEVNEVSGAAMSLSADAKAKTKACVDFVTANRTDMNPPRSDLNGNRALGKDVAIPEEAEKPTLPALLGKVNEISKKTETALQAVVANKVKATKKLNAKTKLGSLRQVFQRYDKDGDGVLSRKEVQAFTKSEYTFTIPVGDMDAILRVLVDEGKRGVAFDAFQRLKSFIGIFREKARDTNRREARLAKEKEIEAKREELKQKADEVSRRLSEAADEVKKLEAEALPLATKAKDMKSTEMIPLADAVDALVKDAKAAIAKARELIGALSDKPEPELKGFVSGETQKFTAQATRLDGQVSKCDTCVSKFRAEVARKDAQELEDFRSGAIKLMRYHQTEKQLGPEDFFKAMDRNGDGRVDESEFQSFFAKCEKPTASDDTKDANGAELSEEDFTRLFNYLDEAEEGAVSKDSIIGMIRCFMKVAKETVITNDRSIKGSKPMRRLDVEEVCEVLEGPVEEGTVELMRMRVRMLRDDAEGWVTPKGNQGTPFFEERPGGLVMKVMKETILTPTFEISGEGAKDQSRKLKDTTRKLKEGDLVEVREWMRKEEASGLMRMKVRTRNGGHLGWATAVGSSGVKFLEVA